MDEQEQTARADLNGLLAALGASSVDEALDRIEQLREYEEMLDWLTKADAELSRNWDEWRVSFGMYPMTDSHYQSQDDDWTVTPYVPNAMQALLTAFRQFKKAHNLG
jgi:hypothetical protein